MTKPKYHPLVTDAMIADARKFVTSDVTDEQIAELLSGNLEMLEGWSEPDPQ